MYFDLGRYLQMLGVALESRSLKARRLALPVLGAVPAASALHALCFHLDPLLFPGLRRRRVQAPVFIIGHARSGTTFMHRLLSKDPGRYSYFLLYELFFPSLLEKKALRALGALDARLLGGRLARAIKARDEETHRFAADLHATGLTLPDEDDTVLFSSCASGFWNVFIPLMCSVDFYHLDEQQPAARRPLLDHYEACVQRQLELTGGQIHLSKNPIFSGRVESLIEKFPDARFVLMMRSPCETIPSLLSLLRTVWRKEGWEEETIRRSLRALAEQSFHTYRHPLEALARHPEVRQIVVDYRDLVAAPRRTVERVYEALELPLSPEYDRVLLAEEQRARSRESVHHYDLEEFGLRADELHRALSDLFARFGWEEPRARAAEGASRCASQGASQGASRCASQGASR